ncbi:glycine betaine ABC transporter substrate-binding protein [Acidihalobacter prosperus]|uniref:ABC-type glycine betaine transport system substrate-binding domain-containing protein n=1 Tax=Acidihalobacter prosperus TaxID=160660 RepID=A0A1A6C0T1_9GAMM|nr:glycine betaine ABC transporter substrate-binding protein [Acidihalobacter prosperus]OBS08165.1 hypothetical protein Thpro_022415 [Acidihalobacter prosperus]
MKRISRLLGTLILAFSAAGIAMLPAAQAAAKPTIKLGYVQSWPSSAITTSLAATVIRERLHTPVEMVSSAAGPMWEAVASDHTDAMLTAWLPTTHKTYYEKLWTRVVNLGPNVTGTQLGLAVPKYVPVNTIAGLEKYAGKFQDRIVGVGAGAGINMNTETAIKTYGLKSFQLQTSSTAAMTAQLQRAIKRKQWIVVTAWTPMWMWAKFDIKYLKDPKNVYGVGGHINTIANPGLIKKDPAVFTFLRRFSISSAQLQQMMLEAKNGKPVKSVVAAFIKAHPKQVQGWLD